MIWKWCHKICSFLKSEKYWLIFIQKFALATLLFFPPDGTSQESQSHDNGILLCLLRLTLYGRNCYSNQSQCQGAQHIIPRHTRMLLWGTIYKSGINAAFYAKLRHLYKASKIVNFSLTIPYQEVSVVSSRIPTHKNDADIDNIHCLLTYSNAVF